MKKFLLLVMALAALSVSAKTDEAKMNKFIDNLMSKMTLQEKLGQLNLPVSGEIVTGSAKSSDVAEKSREVKWAVCSTLKVWTKYAKCKRLP